MDASQPSRNRDQLGEQPGNRAAPNFLVLGAVSLPEVGGAVPGALRRDARVDLLPRLTRGTVSLVLFLTQHPSHRRGAWPILRRGRLPRIAQGCTLASAGGADSHRAERAAGVA